MEGEEEKSQRGKRCPGKGYTNTSSGIREEELLYGERQQ